MNPISKFLIAVAALLCVVMPGLAMAQAKTPASVIAIIDGQKINREAAALKNARQQLEQYRFNFQSEIAKEEEKLRAEEQEIARQRSVLAPEAFEQRRQAFQGKVIDLQKRIQERSQSLEKMLNSVREQVTLQVIEILKALAQERGFNIVLDRAQVQIFVGDNIDITVEVLKRLDQRLPSVKVALPAGK
ncbi:MAG: OmpH family outer membrane protein [Ferrovibrio sp.]|uniref:OmpH family outer membrane protein n=1 Tax=Ferrovibrio sp. TaxID=1917215 RepID=UPI003918916E